MKKKHCHYMRKSCHLVILVIISLFFILPSTGFSLSEHKNTTVNIGILFDGKTNSTIPFIHSLRSELNALLGSNYDINVNDKHILDGQWSFTTIENNYAKLVSDPEIQIIIGSGVLTASVISKKKEFKKPVIAIGIIDPIIQGHSPTVYNKSGIHNLTYIMGDRSIANDLETFHEVYPYKKLGIIYYDKLSKVITDGEWEKINQLVKMKTAQFSKIPIKENVAEISKHLDGVDAVYISYLGQFEGEAKQKLIETINKQKKPSFGYSVTDAQSGILAAIASGDMIKKISRRISLNIEAILYGKDPADFKIFADFEKTLTINMKTAAQIGVSPKFTLLSRAELLNEHYLLNVKRNVNLIDVMKEAALKNLNIEISKTYVENAKHDIARAKTDYYPHLSVGLDGVIIDRESARKANGAYAEQTSTGNITWNQLIYSDQVIGNISSQKLLHQASLFGLNNTELDVVLETTNAYFRILKAQTTMKIQKDNISLIKQNLKIAKQREVVGYSGRSDTLRWQSELATTSTELLAAKQEFILAKNDLNRILNRSQNELFHIEDTFLDDTFFARYSCKTIEKYIDNQNSLDTFKQFYIKQCITNSVEIKELSEKQAALERSVTSLKRKQFLPTVSFSAKQDYVFSRDGVGANTPGADPIDNPWTAGIYATLPFFEGGSASVDSRNKLTEISRIRKQKRIVAQQTEQNARAVLSDVMVKMVQLDSSHRAAVYAKKRFELVQDLYAEGAVSVVELADAQNHALVNELNSINSIYEYLMSIFAMERLYGMYSLLMPLDSNERLTQKFKTYYEQITN